jgi:hypothetical protein
MWIAISGAATRPGEVIRHAPLAFVGEQLGIAPEALADYAARGPTRYEQLDTLRDVFGFQPFSRPVRVELQAWLLPPALTTTNGVALSRLLLDELRRRRIIVPGITPVERMVGKALLDAERHVGDLLTRNLTVMRRDRLDALLDGHDSTSTSVLAWVRQPPGKPGRRAFSAILDRLAVLRAIDLDPASSRRSTPNGCVACHRKAPGSPPSISPRSTRYAGVRCWSPPRSRRR